MKKLWLTYAWEDNADQNVDYLIHELDKLKDIEVKFDKRNLIPGQRLWQQIGGIITDPNACDAWGILLTGNSIKSQACIEELSYALDRAISSNGEQFPIFALLYNIDIHSAPAALKIRLCIPLENNDFLTQVHSAVYRTSSGYVPQDLSSWDITMKEDPKYKTYTFEFRPRFDRISPYVVAVDLDEKLKGNVFTAHAGPSGHSTNSAILFNRKSTKATLSGGIQVWLWSADNEVNSTTSIYLFCKNIPRRIWYGSMKKLILLDLSDPTSYIIEK